MTTEKVFLCVRGVCLSGRLAQLCMSRADVLITSLSTMGYSAAVLQKGVVFSPLPQTEPATAKEPDGGVSGDGHLDLREEYLDWAEENWFVAGDVGGHGDTRRAGLLRTAIVGLLNGVTS